MRIRIHNRFGDARYRFFLEDGGDLLMISTDSYESWDEAADFANIIFGNFGFEIHRWSDDLCTVTPPLKVYRDD
jgi:hypothetical protein